MPPGSSNAATCATARLDHAPGADRRGPGPGRRPGAFARVTIHCGDGNSLSLATVADGTAIFYPGLDRLGERVRVAVPGGAARTIELTESGGREAGFTSARAEFRSARFDSDSGDRHDRIDGRRYRLSEVGLRTILRDLRRTIPPRYPSRPPSSISNSATTTTSLPVHRQSRLERANLRAQYAAGGGDYSGGHGPGARPGGGAGLAARRGQVRCSVADARRTTRISQDLARRRGRPRQADPDLTGRRLGSPTPPNIHAGDAAATQSATTIFSPTTAASATRTPRRR